VSEGHVFFFSKMNEISFVKIEGKQFSFEPLI